MTENKKIDFPPTKIFSTRWRQIEFFMVMNSKLGLNTFLKESIEPPLNKRPEFTKPKNKCSIFLGYHRHFGFDFFQLILTNNGFSLQFLTILVTLRQYDVIEKIF